MARQSIRNAVCLLAWLAVTVSADDKKATKAGDARPLPRAHSHNDYHHERPLLDALEQGFCSVEADIFLVEGKLLVGHDRGELRAARTLEALYLDILRDRVRANAGRVYRDGPPFTLLVDIKSDGRKTYEVLHAVLERYRSMLTTYVGGKATSAAIEVIISGNRPRETVAAQAKRYAAVDGRLADLETEPPVSLVPLVSDNWRNHFRWRGEGPIPPEERSKLRAIVKKAHDQGRRIRFWATADTVAMWRELDDAGVDLINTDDLQGLRSFLAKQARR